MEDREKLGGGAEILGAEGLGSLASGAQGDPQQSDLDRSTLGRWFMSVHSRSGSLVLGTRPVP